MELSQLIVIIKGNERDRLNTQLKPKLIKKNLFLHLFRHEFSLTRFLRQETNLTPAISWFRLTNRLLLSNTSEKSCSQLVICVLMCIARYQQANDLETNIVRSLNTSKHQMIQLQICIIVQIGPSLWKINSNNPLSGFWTDFLSSVV